MIPYAELHCHSNFSLLNGASSPEALAGRAQEIGLQALALTDHDSLAGAMRFWTAMRHAGLHAVIGAEITLNIDAATDTPDKKPLKRHTKLIVLAENQRGYANLCRLITTGRLGGGFDQETPPSQNDHQPWQGKVAPQLSWQQLEQYSSGLICLTGFRHGPLGLPLLQGNTERCDAALHSLIDIFGASNLFIELQHHNLPQDDLLIRRLCELARRWQLPMVVSNDVHYATRADSRLHDALIAIDHTLTLNDARRRGLLPGHSSAYLATPEEMARRFRTQPAALANTIAIAERCQASLDFSRQRLPAFFDAGEHIYTSTVSEFAHLYQLCHSRLPVRYPDLQPRILKQLAHELEVISNAGLAGYFLIVWDIVRFAREQGIRCQGRGSAANSLVAYLLGITSIDPLQHNLLFERFLSDDRYTTPDIDIDFAADRREEVIQYVYQRYGRDHTAMVCNVVTYRARSALRDLGKALAIAEPVIERLAAQLENDSPCAAADMIEKQIAAETRPEPAPQNPLALLAGLLRQIDGCPRHLSIHSGGMLITGPALNEIVSLEPATMPGRVICQWDKDSVEDAGLIKIDLLALRTLGLISEAVEQIASSGAHRPDLESLPLDDPAIFKMLQQADTIGAFQVESRAQQQMLPRLKPQRFEEMIIEVAIVRPGPIQGGAVHPYLRRRAGLEPATVLHPVLEPVLAETLGVLLFQEQAIRVAVVSAGFAPGEADMLRRAMSRSRSEEAMQAMKDRFLRGARERGIDGEIAQAIFAQLAGFAGYGFCKSHAASFALIAYQTLWLKCHHPAAFYCALLNQQPMGFYSADVIVGDAQRHGVDLLPIDVNHSDWKYAIEKRINSQINPPDHHHSPPVSLRSGLCALNGLGEAAWQRIQHARREGAFADLADLCHRSRLDRDSVANLIRAGACDSFGERRQLLWQLGEIDHRPDEMALDLPADSVDLPALAALEQTAWEYELLGLSPDGQVMRHYRAALRGQGVASTWQVKECEAGRRVRVAGMMVVRQRPATAKGIVFISLEDESGLLDLVVKPDTYTRLRTVLRGSVLLLITGIVQRAGRAVSVLVDGAEPLGRI